MTQLYDAIGSGYADRRHPDPRFESAIVAALGDADPVVNVGAGTGSYEPGDRRVVAVEPSIAMIRQRRAGSAPVARASALDLPFDDGAFAAGMAVLTLHHWPDPARGLRELMRVARGRLVLVTWDTQASGFWLIEDYFPAIRALDQRTMPSLPELRGVLGDDVEVRPLPVPHDCSDGFLGAYWRRPEAYLDAGVRGSISAFSLIGDVDAGVARLRGDLEDGTWERRHGHLLEETELDLGYRLVIARHR